MHWVIYDHKRRYGIYYNTQQTSFITFSSENPLNQLPKNILEEKEVDYQQLWKDYFQSVNIPERQNMKLHLRQVPKRYWKYLTEK